MHHLTAYERRLTKMQEEIVGNENLTILGQANEGLANLDEDAGSAFGSIAE